MLEDCCDQQIVLTGLLVGALSPVNLYIGIISGLKETFKKRYIVDRTK